MYIFPNVQLLENIFHNLFVFYNTLVNFSPSLDILQEYFVNQTWRYFAIVQTAQETGLRSCEPSGLKVSLDNKQLIKYMYCSCHDLWLFLYLVCSFWRVLPTLIHSWDSTELIAREMKTTSVAVHLETCALESFFC